MNVFDSLAAKFCNYHGLNRNIVTVLCHIAYKKLVTQFFDIRDVTAFFTFEGTVIFVKTYDMETFQVERDGDDIKLKINS